MLLTITTTVRPATDLGFLLVKHPDRVQAFEQSFGTAHVFYPDAGEERCTAALLLEVDPVKLAKTRRTPDFSLGQYVNDRPYAASSLLASAMANVFRTAMRGRSDDRRRAGRDADPADRSRCRPCRAAAARTRPYASSSRSAGGSTRGRVPLDERFPEWGDSRYVTLRLDGELRLSRRAEPAVRPAARARQLQALLGRRRRGRQAGARGRGLAGHPPRARPHHPPPTSPTAAAWSVRRWRGSPTPTTSPRTRSNATRSTRRPPTRASRWPNTACEAVLDALRTERAPSVIDLGCGSGRLTARLLKDPYFRSVAGTDVSARAILAAERRLKPDRMPPAQRERLTPVHRRADVRGRALPRVRRGRADGGHRARRPAAAARRRARRLRRRRAPRRDRHHAERRVQRALRGPDRPPPPRPPLRVDARGVPGVGRRVAAAYGYQVRHVPVGDDDPEVGAPTQMGVFTR